ncbi:MAG: relaxase/mobilization nuclease domain-containing protein [Alphaproteobacteria bacterium]|nr:relaxase/mobilization nuclease domain-containing protein [Alphaproteobacteria bacterium]
MQVKAQVRQSGGLAKHLMDGDANELVRQFGGFNLLDLQDVAGSIEAMRETAGSSMRAVLHAKLSPTPEVAKRMTEDDWARLLDHYVDAQGLRDHQVVAVLHVKKGRAHLHVVAGTRNLETGRSLRDWQQYKRNVAIQRRLVREMPELGQACQRGRSATGEPIGPRPLGGHDMEQAQRTEVDPKAFAAAIKGLYERHPTPWEFVTACAEKGWVIASGDKCAIVIDDAGGSHSLSRRLGVKKGMVDRFLAPIADELPDHRYAKGDVPGRRQRVARAARVQAQGSRPDARFLRGMLIDQHLPSASRGDPPTADQRREYLRMRWVQLQAREQGLALETGLKAITGGWQGRDGVTRVSVRGTTETLRIDPFRIAIHSRPAPGSPASDVAIDAMIATAKAQGWSAMHLSGPPDFLRLATAAAAREGVRVSNPDLAAAWQDVVDGQQRQVKLAALPKTPQARLEHFNALRTDLERRRQRIVALECQREAVAGDAALVRGGLTPDEMEIAAWQVADPEGSHGKAEKALADARAALERAKAELEDHRAPGRPQGLLALVTNSRPRYDREDDRLLRRYERAIAMERHAAARLAHVKKQITESPAFTGEIAKREAIRA